MSFHITYTAEELEKLLRPGSAFDTTLIACKCMGCGQQLSHSLRWFYEHGPACASCGGRLDLEDFARAGKTIFKFYEAQLERLHRLRDPSS